MNRRIQANKQNPQKRQLSCYSNYKEKNGLFQKERGTDKRGVSESYSVMSNSLRHHSLQPASSFVHGIFQNTGVGRHSLLQGIFPTQAQNPGLPHCRQTLYCLSHQGNPDKRGGAGKKIKSQHDDAILGYRRGNQSTEKNTLCVNTSYALLCLILLTTL